jgi:4-amino-4-deoxy-L-arabinose transferase-like glycosyltransferase
MESANKKHVLGGAGKRSINFALVWMVILMACFAVIRTVYLSADPPAAEISPYVSAFHNDEGWYVHNAVNRILFGKWELGNYNLYLYIPGYTLIQWVTFYLFGVSPATARLMNVLLSLLSIFLIWASLKGNVEDRVGLWAMAFCGFNFIFTMYNRTVLVVTTIIFPLMLSFYFLMQARRTRDIVFAGLAAASSFYIRISGLYFGAVVSLAMIIDLFLCDPGERREKWNKLWIFIGSFLAGIAVFFLIWVFPRYTEWFALLEHHFVGHVNPSRLFTNIIWLFRLNFFHRSPVVSSLAFLYMAVTGYRILFLRSRMRLMELIVFCWVLIPFIMLCLSDYHPHRYMIIFFPAMAMAAALFLEGVDRWELKRLRIGPIGFLYLGAVILIPAISVAWLESCRVFAEAVANVLGGDFNSIPPFSETFQRMFWAVIWVLVTILVFALAIKLVRKFAGKRLSSGFILAFMMLTIMAGFNLPPYLTWAGSPKYSIVETARAVEALVEKDEIIYGHFANTLTMENNHPSVFLKDELESTEGFFQTLKIRYAIFMCQSRLLKKQEEYPEIFGGAELLETFDIMNNPWCGDKAYLYRLHPFYIGNRSTHEMSLQAGEDTVAYMRRSNP